LPPEGVWVAYHYGCSADLGGGEYDRPITEFSVSTASAFRFDHITDVAALIKKLRASGDPVSKYVREQWRDRLEPFLGPEEPALPLTNEQGEAIVFMLNALLFDEAFYDSSRFSTITLSDEAKQLAALTVRDGDRLIRFNRLLIEAAFFPLLVRSFAFYSADDSKSFAAALEAWGRDRPRHAVIELKLSTVYVAPINLVLGKNQSLQIRAANRIRPVIRLLDWQNHMPDAFVVNCQQGGRLTLDGLLVFGRGILVRSPQELPENATKEPALTPDGGCGCCGESEVVIRHCTLVPGWGLRCDCEPNRPAEPSFEMQRFDGLLAIEHSIVGSIQVQQNQVRRDPMQIRISDSVLDATSAEREALGAPGCVVAHAILDIARCTVFGRVQAHAIKIAENCIFTGMVFSARRQIGCLRFCYVPTGSRTPRRYHCQPDLAVAAVETASETAQTDAELAAARAREELRVEPFFESVRYGNPTYAQLALTGPDEISKGADDESEMGAFHDLFQPQRHANLQTRLDDYTPASGEAGIIFVN
jgi:hypothetical protein